MSKRSAETYVTDEELADLLDLTTERLRQLRKAGHLPQGRRGRRPLRASLHAYIAYLRGLADRASATSEAKEKITTERAKILELRRMKMSGELMLYAEHIAIVEEGVGIFRTHVASLPARISDEPEERRRMEDHCDAMLQELSDHFQRAADEWDEKFPNAKQEKFGNDNEEN